MANKHRNFIIQSFSIIYPSLWAAWKRSFYALKMTYKTVTMKTVTMKTMTIKTIK